MSAAAAVLIALPLFLFAPALRPGHTLSPLDNLFTAAPWRAIAPRPVPFHARLAAGERARGVWHRAVPPADVTLALVIVRPGADPLDRAEWTHRPALTQVRVATPSDARPSRPWATLAGLFVAAVAATALAWGRELSTPRPL